jgi:hypothetical protein
MLMMSSLLMPCERFQGLGLTPYVRPERINVTEQRT